MSLPEGLGRASHSLLLRLVAERDPGLAAALHGASRPRAFTCSSLSGGRVARHVLHLASGDEAWLRFTGLQDDISEHLLYLAEKPPSTVELDGQSLQVRGATVDARDHPWAGRDDYGELCGRILHAGCCLPRSAAVEFTSPTTFHSQNAARQRMNIPLPLPALVLGSLFERWQAFSPLSLDPDTRRYAEEMVVLSRYRLQTRLLHLKEAGRETGFVGEAAFVSLSGAPYWVGVLHLLAAYAFYAGVGAKTAMGLGQARLMAERSE